MVSGCKITKLLLSHVYECMSVLIKPFHMHVRHVTTCMSWISKLFLSLTLHSLLLRLLFTAIKKKMTAGITWSVTWVLGAATRCVRVCVCVSTKQMVCLCVQSQIVHICIICVWMLCVYAHACYQSDGCVVRVVRVLIITLFVCCRTPPAVSTLTSLTSCSGSTPRVCAGHATPP